MLGQNTFSVGIEEEDGTTAGGGEGEGWGARVRRVNDHDNRAMLGMKSLYLVDEEGGQGVLVAGNLQLHLLGFR